MDFVLVLLVFLALEANCAPINEGLEDITEENQLDNEITTDEDLLGRKVPQDTPQTNENKNPVQEWFENLSKNASTNAQNAMNNIKEWFGTMAQTINNGNNAIASNTPTMYMGSFQLLKMPMPQMGDVIKGMGDLATLAQTFNKVTGLTGGLPQGLPLIPTGR